MRLDAHVGQQRHEQIGLVLAIAIAIRQDRARRARPNAVNAELDRDVAQRRDKIERLADFIDASRGRRRQLLRHRLHRVRLLVGAARQSSVPHRELVPRIERADIKRRKQIMLRRIERQRLKRRQVVQLPSDRAHAIAFAGRWRRIEIP